MDMHLTVTSSVVLFVHVKLCIFQSSSHRKVWRCKKQQNIGEIRNAKCENDILLSVYESMIT